MDSVELVLSRLDKMRAEQREDHAALVQKVDTGFHSINTAAAAHELEDTKRFAAVDKRVESVENTRRSIRWLGATVIVALIGAFFDFVFIHLPRLIASGKP